MHTDRDLDANFDVGYATGYADGIERLRQRDEGLRRLMDAIRASENGDPEPLEELSRQAAGDDLLDVANAAGATPLEVADPGQLVDELERWLRGQD